MKLNKKGKRSIFMREIVRIKDLKDMLKKTGELHGDKPAYKLKSKEKPQKALQRKKNSVIIHC